MRRLLISTFVSLMWIAPALAQEAPPAQRAVPNAAQDLDVDVPPNQVVQSMQQSLRARLAGVGFTDIEMVPTSFLVRAKDRDGNAVMLMLSPDSITEFKVAPSQGLQDDAPGTPSDRSSTGGSCVNDEG